MSDARWCDYGNHAYQAGRPGTIMMGQLVETTSPTRFGNQPANVEQDVREMCPECAAELGLIKDYEAPEAPGIRRASILKELTKKGEVTE